MTRRHVLTILAVGLVLLSGCTGSIPGVGGETTTTTTSASGDWCPEGQTTRFASPQTGEQVSMEVEGIVTHDGREVCKAVWQTNQPENEVAKMEMYYSEDDSYQKIVTYDENGNVVDEVVMTGG
jgi:hypothetical protein